MNWWPLKSLPIVLQAPTISLNSASDLGFSNSDNLTADNLPVIDFDYLASSAPIAGYKLRPYVDGVAHGVQHTISQPEINAGNFGNLFTGHPLSDDEHNLKFEYSGGSGQPVMTNEITFTIDTSPRTAPTIGFATGYDETDIPTRFRVSFTDAVDGDVIKLYESDLKVYQTEVEVDSTDISNGYVDIDFSPVGIYSFKYSAKVFSPSGKESDYSDDLEFTITNNYQATATRFNNDYMRKPTGFAVSGNEGLIAVWIDFKDDGGTTQWISNTASSRFVLYRDASTNKISFWYNPDGAGSEKYITSSTALTSTSGMTLILVSYGPSRLQMYFGDNDESNISSNVDKPFDMSGISYNFGAHYTTLTERLNAEVADYRHWHGSGTGIDLSDVYNRRRFIDASGNPVAFERSGLPVPFVRLSNPYNSFNTNSGSGGNFDAPFGTLEAGATFP